MRSQKLKREEAPHFSFSPSPFPNFPGPLEMPTVAASNQPEDLTVAVSNRSEDLTATLGVGAASMEGKALLKVLREVKNQIIGNKKKNLLYLHLGVVLKIVSILSIVTSTDNGIEDAAVIVQADAAIGNFACGVEAGARVVLEAGAVPHLIQILSHPNENVMLAMIINAITFCILCPKSCSIWTIEWSQFGEHHSGY